MTKKSTTIAYPRLKALGLTVHEEPVAHVLCAELEETLGPRAQKQFNTLFGIQTCPGVDAGPAVYPWDAEAVLERMASSRLTGTQLVWD